MVYSLIQSIQEMYQTWELDRDVNLYIFIDDGHLVSIEDELEMQFIQALLSQINDEDITAYIGELRFI